MNPADPAQIGRLCDLSGLILSCSNFIHGVLLLKFEIAIDRLSQ